MVRRNELLSVATAFLGVSLVMSGCKPQNAEAPPTLPPKPDGISQSIPDAYGPFAEELSSFPSLSELPDSEVLDREIKRIGISQNTEELSIWGNVYPVNEKPLPLNEDTFQIGKERVKTVISLMEKSQNPYFQEAANLLNEGISKGHIRMYFYPYLQKGSNEGAFATTVIQHEGKLLIDMGVSLDAVLNKLDHPLIIALLLTHEVGHIKGTIDYQKALPKSYSVKERYKKEKQRLDTEEEIVSEEAIAYGLQAKAYIYLYGIGHRGEGSLKKDAAMFIRLGSDATSKEWQDYVRREILGLYHSDPGSK